jgi:hypothetical protein
MYWDVINVKPLGDYTLSVKFQDGLEGEVDMAKLVKSPNAGVFAKLADPAEFARVYVEDGVVMWPGELDLAPDAMHHQIKDNRTWVLG